MEVYRALPMTAARSCKLARVTRYLNKYLRRRNLHSFCQTTFWESTHAMSSYNPFYANPETSCCAASLLLARERRRSGHTSMTLMCCQNRLALLEAMLEDTKDQIRQLRWENQCLAQTLHELVRSSYWDPRPSSVVDTSNISQHQWKLKAPEASP